MNKNKNIQDLNFDQFCDVAPVQIRYYLDKCDKVKQTPDWHPEGDVLTHLRIVFNRAKRTGNINLILAAIFHDLGKVDTTVKHKEVPNKWTATFHEKVSAKIVKEHKEWIEEQGGDFEIVLFLVEQHMRAKQINEMRPHKRKVFMEHPFYSILEQFMELDDMSIDYSNDLN